jgi:serine/threonine protein kinase
VIAVKMLNAMTGTHDEQFEAEVNVLMKLKHKNIAELLGYCDGRHEKGNTVLRWKRNCFVMSISLREA